MPNCYTAFEELVYTFGGPWLFGLLLLGLLVLFALVLSVARMKYVAGEDSPAIAPARNDTRLNHSFPFLESLNEVLTNLLRVNFMDTHPFETWFNITVSFNFVFLLSFRLLKQIEVRNLKVMCIGCISRAQIHSVNLGIYLIIPQSK